MMAYEGPAMKILTWNVLHRVHAERHSEPAIERWPDEQGRVRGITALIARALTVEGFDVALLQEVSGDVLAALRAQLPGHAVLNHLYPRVPRAKSDSLRDPTEHLVVIAPLGAKIALEHTFANDPGKGFLSVELPDGTTVVSTHVSWGANGAAQLEVLAQVLHDAQGAVGLGGDFNARREVIEKALGAHVGLLPEGSGRTRPQKDGGEDIDHLLCTNATLREVTVLEHGELSDHRPVAGTLCPT